MTIHPSPQSWVWALLQDLQTIGALRAIDVQLGRFIQQKQLVMSGNEQVDPNLTDKNQVIADQIGLLACLLSHEFSRGHICIHLNHFDVVEALSLRLWFHLHPELSQKYVNMIPVLQQWNWLEVCQQADVVAKTTGLTALPLMFEQTKLTVNSKRSTSERIYLTRYWHYERRVADGFLQRSQPLTFSVEQNKAMQQSLARLFKRDYHFLWDALNQSEIKDTLTRQRTVCEYLDVECVDSLDWQHIEQILVSANDATDLKVLDTLVPESKCLNWQKVAAAVALTRQFSVISGGPGTGKTTTVAKLLAALIEQAQQAGNTLNIQLVAPTGKAAARLTESIGLAIEQLAIDESIKTIIPTYSSTIHRLLGARANTVAFKHHKANPLHLDILVVDEASMVDLPMMFRLLEALPNHARLILLGDKDQLASVEAGAILGDICSFNQVGYQTEFAKQLVGLTGYENLPKALNGHEIADSLCMLRKSYRFHARSGIGQLAKAINVGDTKQLEQVWQQGFDDIRLHELPNLSATTASLSKPEAQQALKAVQGQLLDLMTEGYRSYCELIYADNKEQFVVSSSQQDLLADSNPKLNAKIKMDDKAKLVLEAFNQTRLLCAVREGDFGVERMNEVIEQALTKNNLIQSNLDGTWYVGKPVMVTRNDPTLGLHNGDIGICLLDKSEDGPRLRVYFEMPDGKIKGILPSRVPMHETAFAMTIHKSQGSEFDHTVLLLPVKMNPILTRELVYTGVTRAKSRLNLFANTIVLAQSVTIKTLRTSGLSEKLSGKSKLVND